MSDIVQFRIGAAAARAVSIVTLRDRARDRGLAHWWVEISNARGGGVRITCARGAAVILLEDLGHAIANATELHVLTEINAAVQAIGRELAGETRADESLPPGNRERPLLGM